MDASSVLYDESTNSSMVDLTANQSRLDMLDFGRRYDLFNKYDFDNYDDDESWIRTDGDRFVS